MGVQAGARHPGPKDLEHIFLIYRIVPSLAMDAARSDAFFLSATQEARPSVYWHRTSPTGRSLRVCGTSSRALLNARSRLSTKSCIGQQRGLSRL